MVFVLYLFKNARFHRLSTYLYEIPVLEYSMITEFLVMAGEKTKRLDAFLVNHERGISRSRLQRLIMAGRVRVNALVTKSGQKIKPGDRITLDSPEPGPMMINDRVVSLEILFEDEALLVVNKPAGVVVHPTSGNWHGTLLNGLLAHLQSDGSGNVSGEPGLVHRLDKETSGVMVIAKTEQAHKILSSQFEKQAVTRTYEALVYGRPIRDHGTIDAAIGRDSTEGKKVSIKTTNPQAAITEFTVVQQFGEKASRLELMPRTGRQHQLRVHLASLGCPIIGDPIYSKQEVDHLSEITISRMMLHATCIEFQHPMTKTYREYTAEFPSDMQRAFQDLQKEYPR